MKHLDIYATLKVNDAETGALIGYSEGVFSFEDCNDYDEFVEEYGEEVEAELKSMINPETFSGKCVGRVCFTELAETLDDEEAI